MVSSLPQALIVDDDFITRRSLVFSLRSVGFECREAVNGNEALTLAARDAFDLVVTDLRMPERNGHSLAVELLSRPFPPIIAVYTAVDDPRIAEDLMTRGVDDVVFKPTNYAAFAGKMKGLVARRRERQQGAAVDAASLSLSVCAAEFQPDDPSRDSREYPAAVSLADLKASLREATHLLPVSKTATTLSSLLKGDDTTKLECIMQTVEQDASLYCEVIKVANRAVRLAGSRHVLDIKQAIRAIGTRRIGEIAIAISALRTLTERILPWLDPEIAQLQGIAAQIAVERLSPAHAPERSSEELTVSALAYPMGRVLLGALYPQHYAAMVADCRERGTTLSEAERMVFPLSQSAALAEMLCNWGIPSEIFEPLRYVEAPCSAIDGLPRLVRTKVERLKMAISIGHCAAGRCHPWERPDFPSESLLRRVGGGSVLELIESVRRELLSGEPRLAVQPTGRQGGERDRFPHRIR